MKFLSILLLAVACVSVSIISIYNNTKIYAHQNYTLYYRNILKTLHLIFLKQNGFLYFNVPCTFDALPNITISPRIKGLLFYMRCQSLSGLCWARKTCIFILGTLKIKTVAYHSCTLSFISVLAKHLKEFLFNC